MQIEHLNKETTDGTMRNLDALYSCSHRALLRRRMP